MAAVSIVIPAYNEEKRIGMTLEDYCTFFEGKLGKSFEIYVVLNGCHDRTLDIVRDYAKRFRQIKYLTINEAIGKGGAIIEGFKIAEGDYIGFVDADGSTTAKSYYELYEKIENNDGIIASRWIKGARVPVRQTLMRRIASRSFNLLVRVLFGIKLVDTQCGAKLFTKKAVKSVVHELGVTRWAFDIDLLYLLSKKGFKIIEIPTVWKDHPDSNLKLHKAIPEMMLAIIRLRLVYSPFNFVVDAYNKIADFVKHDLLNK